VLLADFTNKKGREGGMTAEDEEFLCQMMERDDITVVTDGLASAALDLFGTEFLCTRLKDEMAHKCKLYETTSGDSDHQPIDQPRERGGFFSMKLGDYGEYLKRRAKYRANPEGTDKMFTFVDGEGDVIEVDTATQSIVSTHLTDDSSAWISSPVARCELQYVLDFPLTDVFPDGHTDFVNKYKFAGCLPGGKHCATRAVSPQGRPELGPNLYMTPNGITYFHRDGDACSDSGHLCVKGYNEIVMLRRLPDGHAARALSLLSGDTIEDPQRYLHIPPHDYFKEDEAAPPAAAPPLRRPNREGEEEEEEEGEGEEEEEESGRTKGKPLSSKLEGTLPYPHWPTNEAIEKCEESG
jgi:hypothetical protein